VAEQTAEFEGWAILELIGHRRLAGYVRPAQLAGAGLIRIDVPRGVPCEGASASWCPNCGDCNCPERERDLDGEDCPLHKASSEHPLPDTAATQFYAPSALYCLTPCTEEVARKVAKASQVAPVQAWELRPERALPAGGGDDGTF
jgi:hypothetical protein